MATLLVLPKASESTKRLCRRATAPAFLEPFGAEAPPATPASATALPRAGKRRRLEASVLALAQPPLAPAVRETLAAATGRSPPAAPTPPNSHEVALHEAVGWVLGAAFAMYDASRVDEVPIQLSRNRGKELQLLRRTLSRFFEAGRRQAGAGEQRRGKEAAASPGGVVAPPGGEAATICRVLLRGLDGYFGVGGPQRLGKEGGGQPEDPLLTLVGSDREQILDNFVVQVERLAARRAGGMSGVSGKCGRNAPARLARPKPPPDAAAAPAPPCARAAGAAPAPAELRRVQSLPQLPEAAPEAKPPARPRRRSIGEVAPHMAAPPPAAEARPLPRARRRSLGEVAPAPLAAEQAERGAEASPALAPEAEKGIARPCASPVAPGPPAPMTPPAPPAEDLPAPAAPPARLPRKRDAAIAAPPAPAPKASPRPRNRRHSAPAASPLGSRPAAERPRLPQKRSAAAMQGEDAALDPSANLKLLEDAVEWPDGNGACELCGRFTYGCEAFGKGAFIFCESCRKAKSPMMWALAAGAASVLAGVASAEQGA